MIAPSAQAMIDFARPSDTMVIWRLDRLGRSLTHLIEMVMGLQARRINFRSLTEHVVMSTPGGKRTFYLFGALAEMERDVIRQRTKAGLEAVRARGLIGGRPVLHPDTRKLQRDWELYEKKEASVAEIMTLTDCQRETGKNRYLRLFLSFLIDSSSKIGYTEKVLF